MVSAAGGSVDDEAQNDDLKVGNFVAGRNRPPYLNPTTPFTTTVMWTRLGMTPSLAASAKFGHKDEAQLTVYRPYSKCAPSMAPHKTTSVG